VGFDVAWCRSRMATAAQHELIRKVEAWLMKSDDLMGRLEAFAVANNAVFADAVSSTENKLEYTTVFERYQEIIESELTAFLQTAGASHAQFLEACQAVSNASDTSKEVGVVDYITAMTDFNEFKALMVSTYQSSKA
jgi:hypothetical protein